MNPDNLEIVKLTISILSIVATSIFSLVTIIITCHNANKQVKESEKPEVHTGGVVLYKYYTLNDKKVSLAGAKFGIYASETDAKNNKNPMRKPAFIYKVTSTFSSPFSVNILSEAFLYLPLRLILWEHAKITSIGCNTNIHPDIPPGLRALPVHKR